MFRPHTHAKTALAIAICCQASVSCGQFIVAHRGASHDAPENTLAAFQLAWERGADGIEGDFHLSSDGRIVCIHDEDTERVAGVSRVVADTTLEDLRGLDVGAWKGEAWRGETIPTLREVAATVPSDGRFFIELKAGPEIVEPFARALGSLTLSPEQIVVISFDAETIQSIENRLPQLRSHWLTSYKQNKKSGEWSPSAESVAETTRRIGADGLGSKALLNVFDQGFIEGLRSAGQGEFHVWTVDDPAVARRYRELGAWSITTNRPGWLRTKIECRM